MKQIIMGRKKGTCFTREFWGWVFIFSYKDKKCLGYSVMPSGLMQPETHITCICPEKCFIYIVKITLFILEKCVCMIAIY